MTAEGLTDDELCICGHSIYDHCLDDQHCCWDWAFGEVGGACLADNKCGCCTARPRSKFTEDGDPKDGDPKE